MAGIVPSSLVFQSLLILYEAQAPPLPPSLAPGHLFFLFGPLPQVWVTLGSFLTLGGLRTLKAASAHTCFPESD